MRSLRDVTSPYQRAPGVPIVSTDTGLAPKGGWVSIASSFFMGGLKQNVVVRDRGSLLNRLSLAPVLLIIRPLGFRRLSRAAKLNRQWNRKLCAN